MKELHETEIFDKAKNLGQKYAPAQVYNSARYLLNLRKRNFKFAAVKFVKETVFYPLYKMNLTDFDSLYTKNYHLRGKTERCQEISKDFAESCLDVFDPDSVIDFGCGIGIFWSHYTEGVEVKGVEGDSRCKEEALIPPSKIDIKDLTEGYKPQEKFDIAISLETLEHIPEEYDDKAVEAIAHSSDTLLISAAPPGQGGTHHVNEKPKSYWITKFEKYGFEFNKELTQDFKSTLNFSGARKDNLIILQKNNNQP